MHSQQKRAAGEQHSVPVHVMKGVMEERCAGWEDGARPRNTYPWEVGSAEQNGEG